MSEAIAAEDMNKLIDLRKSLMEAIEEHRRKIVALENQLAGITAAEKAMQ